MPSLPISAAVATAPVSGRSRKYFGASVPAYVLYLLLCIALAITAYHRPLPTFDRYLYAGAVASLRYSDPLTIQHIARTEFDAEPVPFSFATVQSEPYFADIYANPNHLSEQLGLFRVKLGYVSAGYLLWRAGLPILVSLRLLSACCLLLSGVVVLVWTRDALLSALLLLTPPVLNMGRMVTADPLSTVIILLALFALTKNKGALAATLLIASIFARSDNLILAAVFLAWMVWRKYISRSAGALFVALALGMSTAINRFAHAAAWRVIMQHGFIKPVIEPLTHPVLISAAGYLQALEGLRAIPYTFMTFWILVSVAAWRLLPAGSILRHLLPLTGVYLVIRLVLFPNFDDRFFVWAYLLAGVALIQASTLKVQARQAI